MACDAARLQASRPLRPTRNEILATLSPQTRLWYAALFLDMAEREPSSASDFRRAARELLSGIPPTAAEYGDALALRSLTERRVVHKSRRRIHVASPTVSSDPWCAENGTCYGDISALTGRPKTVHVEGYYRRDGTYVRGHYRSSPR